MSGIKSYIYSLWGHWLSFRKIGLPCFCWVLSRFQFSSWIVFLHYNTIYQAYIFLQVIKIYWERESTFMHTGCERSIKITSSNHYKWKERESFFSKKKNKRKKKRKRKGINKIYNRMPITNAYGLGPLKQWFQKASFKLHDS